LSKPTGKPRDSKARDSIRTFVCIEIPDSAKQRIDELENQLRGIDAQVSWVKPSNVHLTLKFLGGVPEDKIDAVAGAAERAAQVTGPFEIEIAGTGCFPSARSPRVLWIGLAVLPDELVRLHAALEGDMHSLGFEREARRFAPHLTIGRLRSPRNGAALAQKLMDMGFEPARFVANQIIVMRSQLKPTGSIYTPLKIIPFRTRSK
jgi:RNA 2',3'-cyclic 3'-phosphodiesterase